MDRSFGDSRSVRWVCGAFVLTWLGACASEIHRPIQPEFDLRDPGATRRLTAISTVERTGDRSSIPALIEMLDDDDESVRLSAGSALKAMTGHDTGYRAYAPPEERRTQIARWRAWWSGASRPPATGATTGSATQGAAVAKDASFGADAGYTSGGTHVRTP